ncbi:tetratricopeptide repeat protein, partial [Streptomyces sp. NPDC005568]
MSRFSREHKREPKRGRQAPVASVPGARSGSGLTPIEVRVTARAGAGVPGDRSAAAPASRATVGGMPVVVNAGESAQDAVLNYLHRIALATGHPVLAMVHDESIGYVVPLQVYVDGSSEYAGNPVRVGPPPAPPQAPVPAPREAATASPSPVPAPARIPGSPEVPAP